tara:strand:- start:678 stop:851 length:174 start_codon:yes stop_codon:yes gene_type:complete
MPTKKEQQPVEYKRVRRYNGPPKGSDEAKERMAKVRAAQWAKNGLVVSEGDNNATEQ